MNTSVWPNPERLSEARQFCQDFVDAAPQSRYVLGRNVYAQALAETLEIAAFVDDFADLSTFKGRPVVKTSEVEPGGLVVSCAMEGRPVTARNRLQEAGLRQLDYFAFSEFAAVELPTVAYWLGFEDDYEKNRAQYSRAQDAMSDPESASTFERLLNFRLSKDLTYMDGFCSRLKEQYFEDFLELAPSGEVFVDAGCFDGQTSLDFIERCPNFERVYALEPDPRNLEVVRGKLAQNPRVEIIEAGLFDKSTEVSFNMDGSASTITSGGDSSIRVGRLDDLVSGRVSFIKMDIEGAEQQALVGAKNTILAHHPKLAICVYHRCDDFWKIPDIVWSIRSDYQVFLRHYTEGYTETVMYFVPVS